MGTFFCAILDKKVFILMVKLGKFIKSLQLLRRRGVLYTEGIFAVLNEREIPPIARLYVVENNSIVEKSSPGNPELIFYNLNFDFL